MKVGILGAGIGGLALGIALRRRGHEVVVLERRDHFQDEGAGVVLGPNVMSAIQLLELDTAIEAAGRAVTGMNITDQTGRVLSRSGYRVAELPRPGVAIHRSRLHEILRARFDGELRLGAQPTELRLGQRPSLLVGGQQLSCDLIVGADGIRSQARRELAPDFQTRYAGATCFRFVVDRQWTDDVFEMWGAGKRLGVVPLGEGRTYVFLTLNSKPRAPAPFSTLAEFRALWAEFGGPAPSAFDALDDLSKVLHNDLEDGISPKFWAPGLVLLGDAAHAVTPNMGQGAGLAIEDACCLAKLLSERPEREAALAEYEALRRPRATWIRDQSYSLGKVAQLESPAGRWLRNLALRLTPASMNERALRRIVTEMPGVPLA
jgi:2-polyprenyl-6-methoxyphenol hydroxylase-like FAD-dependent oxidoreductase